MRHVSIKRMAIGAAAAGVLVTGMAASPAYADGWGNSGKVAFSWAGGAPWVDTLSYSATSGNTFYGHVDIFGPGFFIQGVDKHIDAAWSWRADVKRNVYGNICVQAWERRSDGSHVSVGLACDDVD